MEARESVLSSPALGDVKDIRPIIQPGMSDSASLDNVLEFFVMSGLSLLKSRSKGNAEPNTAEIEGEEDQKTFLRGCRTYTAEIEGEEVQKSFLLGTCSQVLRVKNKAT